MAVADRLDPRPGESARACHESDQKATTSGSKVERVQREFQWHKTLPSGRPKADDETKRDCRPGGLGKLVDEANIVCEGWLRSRKGRARGGKSGGDKPLWKQQWAILIRDVDFGVGTLVLTDSYESR